MTARVSEGANGSTTPQANANVKQRVAEQATGRGSGSGRSHVSHDTPLVRSHDLAVTSARKKNGVNDALSWTMEAWESTTETVKV